MDFYATWCANCKAFDQLALRNARLNTALQQAVLVKIYDTDAGFRTFQHDPRFPELGGVGGQPFLPLFAIYAPQGEFVWKGQNYEAVETMVTQLALAGNGGSSPGGTMMRLVISIGLVLSLGSLAAVATPLESLLHAADFMPLTEPGPAPDFQLPDAEERLRRLRDQQGQVVLLNFWATWCPPCVQEMPLLAQLAQALRQQPLVLWAINFHESREQVRRFMAHHRLPFPALLDREGTVSALYRVGGLPATYLMNCAGHLVGLAMGDRQWTDEAIRTLLDTLLREAACRRPSPGGMAPSPGKEP